jgi:diguanylate cyclase (GGDEF)-like protein
MIGATLALGAPLGLAVLRVMQARMSDLPLGGQLATDAAVYVYTALSTILVFSAFGFVLGRQADHLHELSSKDSLTGLRNRRVMQERLGEELKRARRYGSVLSLLLMDVDGLKGINDAHGHRAGDAALRRTASAIRSGSRATDVAGRWGGDEFVLLAPDTSADEAWVLADRIRGFVADAAATPLITISVGVATFRWAEVTWSAEDVVRAADSALYEAKRLGRNRVVIA